MLERRPIERKTGWVIHHRSTVRSTNDEAARLRDARAGPRVALIADRQVRGRGRAGHTFASPEGGLYVSLLVAAAPEDLPGPLTAAIALAAASSIEMVSGVCCGIKWPNDLWVGRRKLAGILLEAAGPALPVVVGIGVNLEGVPEGLPGPIRRQTTALDLEAGRRIGREILLEALLPTVDQMTADLRFPRDRRRLEAAWHDRLLFRGEAITYAMGGERRAGILRDASFDGGLLIDDEVDGLVHRRPEQVHDVRPQV